MFHADSRRDVRESRSMRGSFKTLPVYTHMTAYVVRFPLRLVSVQRSVKTATANNAYVSMKVSFLASVW